MQISCLRGTVTSPAQTHLSADYDAIPASLLFMWCATTVRFNTFVQSHNWELIFNEYWVSCVKSSISIMSHLLPNFLLWKLALDISSPLIIENEQSTLFKGNLNLCWRLAAMWLLLTIAILLYLFRDCYQIWQKPSFSDEKFKVVIQGNPKVWSPVCADFFKSLVWKFGV